MKKLKYPRTVYYDRNNKLWVSYYVNTKGKTKIDKKGKNLTDVIKEGYKKGSVNKLNKAQIDDYSYFVENKKSVRHNYIRDFIKHEKHLSKILEKKSLTDTDEMFLKNCLDLPYFEYKFVEIKQKLKKPVREKTKTQHIIKQVTIFKYSSLSFFIPTRQHTLLKSILKDFPKIQIIFKIDDEEFFTPYFIPKKNTNYERMFTNILKKYPAKIAWGTRDIRLTIK